MANSIGSPVASPVETTLPPVAVVEAALLADYALVEWVRRRQEYEAWHKEFDRLLHLYGAKKTTLRDSGYAQSVRELAAKFREHLRYTPRAETELQQNPPRLVAEINEALRRPQEAIDRRYRDFSKMLTTNLVKQLAQQNAQLPKDLEAKLPSLVVGALAHASSPEGALDVLTQGVLRSIEKPSEKQFSQGLEAAFNELKERAQLTIVLRQRMEDIEVSVLESHATNLETYSDILVHLAQEHPEQGVQPLALHAEKVERLGSALSSVFIPAPSSPTAEALTREYVEALTKQTGNLLTSTLMTFFSKDTQYDLMRIWFHKKTAEALSDDTQLSRSLGIGGQAYVRSPGFRALREAVLTSAPPAVRTKTLFDRTMAPVVRRRLERVPAKAVMESVLASIELHQMGTLTKIHQPPSSFLQTKPPGGFVPSAFSQFVASYGDMGHKRTGVFFHEVFMVWHRADLVYSLVHFFRPEALHFENIPGLGWFFTYGKSRAATEAAKSLVGKAAVTGILTKLGVQVTTDAVVGVATGGVGLVAKWLIQAGAWLGTKLLRPITSLLLRAAGWVLNSGWLFGGEGLTAKQAVVFVGVVVGAPFLFVLLTIFGIFPPFFLSGLNSGAGGSGTSAGPTIAYSGPLPPPSPISQRPVVGGAVTQRPFEPGTTHERTNAFDVAVPSGTAVRPLSQVNYPVDFVGDNPAGQYGNNPLGNYVILARTTPSGKTCYDIYGHLLDVSSDIKEKVALQKQIGADPGLFERLKKETGKDPLLFSGGDVIGHVDATGNVFSKVPGGDPNHLHIQTVGCDETLSFPGT